jgi:hypothetical protein
MQAQMSSQDETDRPTPSQISQGDKIPCRTSRIGCFSTGLFVALSPLTWHVSEKHFLNLKARFRAISKFVGEVAIAQSWAE